MKTELSVRLWRVEWNHRNGYQAPSQYVEAKTRKEVTEITLKSRLKDFPEQWSYVLVPLNKSLKNGKWKSFKDGIWY